MIRPLLFTVVTLAGPALFGGPFGAPPQTDPNSIGSVGARDVSPTELHIFVVYSYDGARGADHVSVTASALQGNGAAVPGLVNDITRAIARIGTGKALTVLRRESAGRPVTSTQIEVCLNHRVSGDILCKTIPHTHAWGDTTPPPPPTPPTPPSPPVHPTPPQPTPSGTCTVTGDVSGPLRWVVSGNRGGHPVSITSELREMVMSSASGGRFTAQLRDRRYQFSGVPAGHTYRLGPGRFRSDPSIRTIDCRRNFTIRNADFRITGGPHSN
jgi:hypothetical protein